VKSAYTIAALEARADRVLAWRAALEESLPQLAEMGYEGVELMVRGPEQFDVQATQAVLDRTGLKIAAIGTGPIAQERGLSLSAADEAMRRGRNCGRGGRAAPLRAVWRVPDRRRLPRPL
jgi:sugar phosphate isomerase/epimerase